MNLLPTATASHSNRQLMKILSLNLTNYLFKKNKNLKLCPSRTTSTLQIQSLRWSRTVTLRISSQSSKNQPNSQQAKTNCKPKLNRLPSQTNTQKMTLKSLWASRTQIPNGTRIKPQRWNQLRKNLQTSAQKRNLQNSSQYLLKMWRSKNLYAKLTGKSRFRTLLEMSTPKTSVS